MIKNVKKWQEFEKNLIASEPVDIEQNFRIMNAMYEEARALGIFPLKDPMEGIELKIKIARVVNSV